jgi:hypothetical protein
MASVAAFAKVYTDPTLLSLGVQARRNMKIVCDRGAAGSLRRTTSVTHYYVPLLKNYSSFECSQMEGVCRYWVNNVEYIANSGMPSVPLAKAECKNGVGYGRTWNCTHPCRSLAANPKFHRPGEIIFFPALVGKSCGSGQNAMIHDGFMVVNDTGSPAHFNREGRFDFFWGECKNSHNGMCMDSGAIQISTLLSDSPYCRVWRPADPTYNEGIKIAFQTAVRTEALDRNDNRMAAAFDLDNFLNFARNKAQPTSAHSSPSCLKPLLANDAGRSPIRATPL